MNKKVDTETKISFFLKEQSLCYNPNPILCNVEDSWPSWSSILSRGINIDPRGFLALLVINYFQRNYESLNQIKEINLL